MSTGEDGVGLVLLDQWHVDLLIPTHMDDHAVERMRDRVDVSLRQWAERTQAGLGGISLRVEQ